VDKSKLAQIGFGQDFEVLGLQNIVWAEPITTKTDTELSIALYNLKEDQLGYEMFSQTDDGEVIHCQGEAFVGKPVSPIVIDVEKIRQRMHRQDLDISDFYKLFAAGGAHYGPTYRGVRAIHQGEHQLIAELQLPDALTPEFDNHVLHPSMLDSALQSALGLFQDMSVSTVHWSLPFAVESLRVYGPCKPEMMAWVRYSAGQSAADPGSSIVRIDVDLCDPQGEVSVQLRGVSYQCEVAVKTAAVAPVSQSLPQALPLPLAQSAPIPAAKLVVVPPPAKAVAPIKIGAASATAAVSERGPLAKPSISMNTPSPSMAKPSMSMNKPSISMNNLSAPHDTRTSQSARSKPSITLSGAFNSDATDQPLQQAGEDNDA
jgi:acyl transferase domain-containing protein